MKTSIVRKIAVLTCAILVGCTALSQVFHDDSAAIGMCSIVCHCVRCGWARSNNLCLDTITFCSGPGLVRNCSSFCGAR